MLGWLRKKFDLSDVRGDARIILYMFNDLKLTRHQLSNRELYALTVYNYLDYKHNGTMSDEFLLAASGLIVGRVAEEMQSIGSPLRLHLVATDAIITYLHHRFNTTDFPDWYYKSTLVDVSKIIPEYH